MDELDALFDIAEEFKVFTDVNIAGHYAPDWTPWALGAIIGAAVLAAAVSLGFLTIPPVALALPGTYGGYTGYPKYSNSPSTQTYAFN